jgi:hypothetical protein
MQLNIDVKYALIHYNVPPNKVRFMTTRTKSILKTTKPYNV